MARVTHETLRSAGCMSYVKTVHVGYNVDGVKVVVSYVHGESIEIALAIGEDHPDDRRVDVSRQTWRTFPFALNPSMLSNSVETIGPLIGTCERMRHRGAHGES